MKHITKITLFVITFHLCSCGEKKKEETLESKAKEDQAAKTQESVLKDFMSHLEAMRDLLSEIKDKDSASSAVPKLTQIGFKLNMAKTDMQKLNFENLNQDAKLKKEFGVAMQNTMGEIDEIMNKLKTSSPEAYDVLYKTMKPIMEK